jgi:hypothetical protein
MPHLIDSDDEGYCGAPNNEDGARERIKAQRTDFSQAYCDLPEKTLQELIRMPLMVNMQTKENIDRIDAKNWRGHCLTRRLTSK